MTTKTINPNNKINQNKTNIIEIFNKWKQRPCSHCDHYTNIESLTQINNNQFLCPKCKTNQDIKSAQKAQPDLFIQQLDLFPPN